jgi:hypothetical protein
MQFRVERATTNPFGRRKRFVEDGEGTVGIDCAGFGFSKSNLDESVEKQNLLIAQKFDAAAHLVEPAASRAAFNPRHALEEDPKRSPKWQFVLACEPGELDGVLGAARKVAAHQLEHRCVKSPLCTRTDMREANETRLGAGNKRNRPFDVPSGHNTIAR